MEAVLSNGAYLFPESMEKTFLLNAAWGFRAAWTTAKGSNNLIFYANFNLIKKVWSLKRAGKKFPY